MRWRDPDAAPAGRVTAVEIFFDVIFVFTLTQLTIGSLPPRLAAAFSVFVSIPIGAMASAWLHLASVLGVLVVMLVVSGRRTAVGTTVAHAEAADTG